MKLKLSTQYEIGHIVKFLPLFHFYCLNEGFEVIPVGPNFFNCELLQSELRGCAVCSIRLRDFLSLKPEPTLTFSHLLMQCPKVKKVVFVFILQVRNFSIRKQLADPK